MRAIILAAGQGKRISNVTNRPKCVLEVGGETIIGRQLRLLEKAYCASRIVVGYKAKEIIDCIGWGKDIVYNPLWKQSNTLVSLMFAISDRPIDTLVINGDVVFGEGLIKELMAHDYSAAAVQFLEKSTDEEVKVICGTDNRVKEIGKHCSGTLEAVGVYLLRAPLLRAIREKVSSMQNPWTAYYEDAINLVLEAHPMSICFTKGAIEIDTPSDYEAAQQLYTGSRSYG